MAQELFPLQPMQQTSKVSFGRIKNTGKSSRELKWLTCFFHCSVDTFESHEGVLYCKLHFKSLFSPKAVEDTEPGEK